MRLANIMVSLYYLVSIITAIKIALGDLSKWDNNIIYGTKI
jgi:hypothetical protein